MIYLLLREAMKNILFYYTETYFCKQEGFVRILSGDLYELQIRYIYQL